MPIKVVTEEKWIELRKHAPAYFFDLDIHIFNIWFLDVMVFFFLVFAFLKHNIWKVFIKKF